MKNKVKSSKIKVGLTIFLLVIGITIGMFLGKIQYNAENMGTLADWVSGLGSLGALIFAYYQINDSNKQTQITLKEMKKEHEDSFRPSIYANDKFKMKIDQNSQPDNFVFTITNIGKDVAKDITIEKYTCEDIESLKGLFNNPKVEVNLVNEEAIYYEHDNNKSKNYYTDGHVDDSKHFLYAKEEMKISIPKVYIKALMEYLKEVNSKDIKQGYFKPTLPSLNMNVKYSDLLNNSYIRKIEINSVVGEISTVDDGMVRASIDISLKNVD